MSLPGPPSFDKVELEAIVVARMGGSKIVMIFLYCIILNDEVYHCGNIYNVSYSYTNQQVIQCNETIS